MGNNEVSLSETIRVLRNKRAEAMSRSLIDSFVTINELDILIDRMFALEGEDLSDKVLIGSKIGIALESQGESENLEIELSFDATGDKVSVLSPVGFTLLGKSVGDVCPIPDKGLSITVLAKESNLNQENTQEIVLEKTPVNN